MSFLVNSTSLERSALTRRGAIGTIILLEPVGSLMAISSSSDDKNLSKESLKPDRSSLGVPPRNSLTYPNRGSNLVVMFYFL